MAAVPETLESIAQSLVLPETGSFARLVLCMSRSVYRTYVDGLNDDRRA